MSRLIRLITVVESRCDIRPGPTRHIICGATISLYDHLALVRSSVSCDASVGWDDGFRVAAWLTEVQSGWMDRVEESGAHYWC